MLVGAHKGKRSPENKTAIRDPQVSERPCSSLGTAKKPGWPVFMAPWFTMAPSPLTSGRELLQWADRIMTDIRVNAKVRLRSLAKGGPEIESNSRPLGWNVAEEFYFVSHLAGQRLIIVHSQVAGSAVGSWPRKLSQSR